jgi:hypothetical protein
MEYLADVGERPSLEHSIDRIENELNYDPDNCKWSTVKEQNRNQSQARLATQPPSNRLLGFQ